MLTGVYAARSLLTGEQYDLRSVNDEQEYLEEIPASKNPERDRSADNFPKDSGEFSPEPSFVSTAYYFQENFRSLSGIRSVQVTR